MVLHSSYILLSASRVDPTYWPSSSLLPRHVNDLHQCIYHKAATRSTTSENASKPLYSPYFLWQKFLCTSLKHCMSYLADLFWLWKGACVNSFDTPALQIECPWGGGCGGKSVLYCSPLRWLCLWHSWKLGSVLGWSFTFYSLVWVWWELALSSPLPCCKYMRKDSAVPWIESCLCHRCLLWGFLLISQKRVCAVPFWVLCAATNAKNWNWIYNKAKTFLSCKYSTCNKLPPSAMLAPE